MKKRKRLWSVCSREFKAVQVPSRNRTVSRISQGGCEGFIENEGKTANAAAAGKCTATNVKQEKPFINLKSANWFYTPSVLGEDRSKLIASSVKQEISIRTF